MSTSLILPVSIPYLEPNGSNWAIFMMRFRETMKAMRRWAYFTGHEPRPKPKDANNPTDTEIDAAEIWEYEDSVASYLLSQRLPDATEIRLASCTTTKERWEAITQEYQAKSAYAQADLHQAFLDMRCAKGEDVRMFLASLCYKKEELAAAGVQVSEKEYERTILRGIPDKLATFASHHLSSALIVHGMASIDLDTLINLICEEEDRLKSRSMCEKLSQGGRNSPGTEEAFVATGPRRGLTRRRGKCRRCGEEGHWARKCCTPKKEGNVTVPAAQASLGATSPPKTQIVGETHTVLEIAGESWLTKEEVVHVQMVDTELDLTSGHPEDPHEVAHVQVVSAEPDPLPGD